MHLTCDNWLENKLWLKGFRVLDRCWHILCDSWATYFQMLLPRLNAKMLIRSLATPPPPRLGVDLGPLLSYCASHSSPLHPALRDLQVEALTPSAVFISSHAGVYSGTRELQDDGSTWSAGSKLLAHSGTKSKSYGKMRIPSKVSGARTVLDIGVFTGASSLASALAVGEHGKVYALEKSKTYASIAR